MIVLVASRGPSLATVIESAGHEVIDARPGDAQFWGDDHPAPACDAAVLDLDDSAISHAVVDHLVARQPTIRVVVIRGQSEDWSDLVSTVARVLTPPVTRESLIAALEPAPEADDSAGVAISPAQGSVPSEPRQPAPPLTRSDDLVDAEGIKRLLASVDTMVDIRDVADTMCGLAADRVAAEAVALALPDGPVWRVTGGVGLRPVEGRMIIGSDHWLVAELLGSRRGAVIEHTDITRAQLRQAPLAAIDYLVIATDADVQAVLLAGRDAGPFSKDDLAALQALLREAASDLRQAMDVRELARKLTRFADLP